MECKCGGHTTDSSHIVKTLNGAVEWDSTIDEKDLPVRVHQVTCTACKRCEWSIEKNAN